MTDNQWLSVINKCYKAGRKHKELLNIAENEYIRRYGSNPSEIDDDFWIDTLHYTNGEPDLEKLKDSAELCSERN